MRLARALLPLCLAVLGCGAKSALDTFGAATSPDLGSSGSGGLLASTGGLSSGGSSMGGATSSGGLGGAGGAIAVSGAGGVGAIGGIGGAPAKSRVRQLALGAFHSCAAFDDGSLRCWGTGGYIGAGKVVTIGDNETPDVLPDVDIGGRVVEISASWYHTCALLDNGKVRCFGNGAYGELGYGNVNDIGDDETPASAGDVNVGGRVKDVSAGSYHTCASLDNGKVRCWGHNDHWQLGYASSDSVGDDETPASAGAVDVGGAVVQVAAGMSHSCALLEGGRVRCWGANFAGQLGYGNMKTIGDDETPASAGDVDVGGNVVQIVAGMSHTCALLDNGKVRCWGNGMNGRLGYGNVDTIGDDETPASAGDVDVGGEVIQLAAGDYGTCALLRGGTVRCWGDGEHGELGYGNTNDVGDDETPASAGDVDVGGIATSIDMGFLHTCVTLESGGVRCWGRAATGALGYGNTDDIGDNETPASAGDVRVR